MAVTHYNTHIVANLALPATSVEAASTAQLLSDTANWTSDAIINHAVVINIRCHTGYIGGEPDLTLATELMDEVIHRLKTNLNNLADNYRIMEIPVPNFNSEWDDSGTTGSEMNLIVHKVVNYTQVVA